MDPFFSTTIIFYLKRVAIDCAAYIHRRGSFPAYPIRLRNVFPYGPPRIGSSRVIASLQSRNQAIRPLHLLGHSQRSAGKWYAMLFTDFVPLLPITHTQALRSIQLDAAQRYPSHIRSPRSGGCSTSSIAGCGIAQIGSLLNEIITSSAQAIFFK
jgi:hypothetical protein